MTDIEREKSNSKASLSFYWGSLAAIVAVTFLVYSNSFDAPWHLDDRPGILSNQALKNGDLSGLWAFHKNRFLTYLTLSWNYQYSGIETQSYHFVNVLIHSLNGCLLFALAYFLSIHTASSKSRIIWSLGTALLFTLHPLTTGSVTYIVQRAESLCAFFLLSALLSYGYGRGSLVKKRAYLFYGLSLAMGAAALLCKEVGGIGALLILAFEWTLLNKEKGLKAKLRALAKQKSIWPWLILLTLTGLGLFVSGQSTQLFHSVHSQGFGNISYLDYQLTQTKVLLRYLQLSILPIGQSVDHDVALIQSPWVLDFPASAAALGLLSFGVYRRSKIEPLACFSAVSILIVLAPSSSVFVLPDLMFEHRFYLPLAFLALYAGAELRRIPKGSMIVLIILLITLSLLTVQRNQIWQTESGLWLDALEKAPNKERSLINAANALSEERSDEASERSRDLYLRVLEQSPRSSKARVNLGLTYVLSGQKLLSSAGEKPDQRSLQEARLCFLNAEFHFKRVLRDKADHFIAYNNLGQLYLNYLDRPHEAESCFREVLGLTKSLPSPWFFLGTILLKQSKLREAIECFQTYLSLHDPNQGDSKLKDACAKALKNAQKALKKRP